MVLKLPLLRTLAGALWQRPRPPRPPTMLVRRSAKPSRKEPTSGMVSAEDEANPLSRLSLTRARLHHCGRGLAATSWSIGTFSARVWSHRQGTIQSLYPCSIC
ncbi:hypothetical protein P168DRAFT_68179 [Aspergillus campestris IBT 28561]|uniref:Uncharacterized protein n=1 Tax=Aspergillus campestris (strain IBT 28561) TaxID=1392248 RepID=A0A2I1CS51_ASPC2|nr:uncharacterized protein P168DRAFT_68179 [Aspergillus campestris IBT 28561]PKY00441.1 hypothetical protein P168DRAFT_68179 [Aspergillus campestris IBT 28561]